MSRDARRPASGQPTRSPHPAFPAILADGAGGGQFGDTLGRRLVPTGTRLGLGASPLVIVTLTFWLCALGTPVDAECDRIALPWYGSFMACQLQGPAEIAGWLRRAGRENDRVLRYRCTVEPVPEKFAQSLRVTPLG